MRLPMKYQYSRGRFLRLLRIPLTRTQAGEGAVANGFDHHAQVLMIVILKRDKPKRLKNGTNATPQGIQHFSHAVDVTGVGLKSDFDEIALGDRSWQLQQSSRCRDYLKPTFGTVSVAQFD
jgi:hypothetical protein